MKGLSEVWWMSLERWKMGGNEQRLLLWTLLCLSMHFPWRQSPSDAEDELGVRAPVLELHTLLSPPLFSSSSSPPLRYCSVFCLLSMLASLIASLCSKICLPVEVLTNPLSRI